MERETIIKILEKLYENFKDQPFTREHVSFVMLIVTNKSSRISNSRDLNTLIDLGLIQLVEYPCFVLTKTAFKLLKEIDAILPNEYLKLTANKDLLIETKDTDKTLGDYVPDKTLCPEIPEKYKEEQPK